MPRKHIRRTFFALLAFVALAATALMAVFAWVATGPRSLDFLTPRIERALLPEGAPFTISIKETVLLWSGWDHPLDLRIRDVRMLSQEGTSFAALPDVSVRFDPLALLLGDIQISRLILRQPSVQLFQDADGELSFGFGSDESKTSLKLSHLFAATAAAPNTDTSSSSGMILPMSLRALVIENAALTIGNAETGNILKAERANVLLRSTSTGIEAALDITLDSGILDGEITEHKKTKKNSSRSAASLRGHFAVHSATQRVSGSLRLEHVLPGALLAFLPKTSETPSAFAVEGLPLSGLVQFESSLNGNVPQVSFSLESEAGTITAPALFAKPIPVDGVKISGSLLDQGKRIEIAQSTLRLQGAAVHTSGVIERKENGWQVDTVSTSENLPVGHLAIYWPTNLAPISRNWIVENITEGVMPKAEIRLSAKPEDWSQPYLPEEAIHGEVDIANARVRYLKGYPEFYAMNGHLSLNGKRVELKVNSGKALSGVLIKEGALLIPDSHPDEPRMELNIQFTAPMRDMAELLAAPGMEDAKPLALDPKTLRGDIAAKLGLAFNASTTRPLTRDALTLDVEATITDMAQPKLLGDMDVENLSGTLTIRQQVVELKGKAQLNAVPLTLSVQHDISGKRAARTSYQVGAIASVEQLKHFGISLPSEVKGILGVETDVTRIGNLRKTHSTVDLTQAAIDFSAYGWTKPTASAAQLELETSQETPTSPLNAQFTLRADALKADGAATLAADAKTLQSITFEHLNLGKTQAYLHYAQNGAKRSFVARGAALDISAFLDKDGQDFSTSTFANLSLLFDLDVLLVSEGRAFRHVKGGLECDASRCTKADIQGFTEEKKPFAYRIFSQNGQRTLEISAANAGDFIAGIGVSKNIKEGSLLLKGAFDDSKPSGPLHAVLDIKDYKLQKAPLLTKILTIGSFTGIVDTLSGQGIGFSKLVAPITLVNDVVTIKQAKTHGPALGLTVDGTLAFKGNTLDVEGTIVPSYTLNSMVGNIPLVGEALVGGKGQGLFAANYSIKGPYKNADVRINPLSVLTPGFLRGLFDIFDEKKTEKPEQ